MAEKIGFKTNLFAINPLNQKEKVPVYFANFVLMDTDLELFLVVRDMIKEIWISLLNIIFLLKL